MAIDSVRRSFAPDLAAPAAARRALDGFRGQLGEDVIERSALAVTEFVTNSVTHAALTAAQPIDLKIQVLPACLRIDVTDEGTAGFEPVVTLPHPGQNSGRGFWIVDQLTDRWGVDFSRSTRVWCEFDLHDRRHNDFATAPQPRTPGARLDRAARAFRELRKQPKRASQLPDYGGIDEDPERPT